MNRSNKTTAVWRARARTISRRPLRVSAPLVSHDNLLFSKLAAQAVHENEVFELVREMATRRASLEGDRRSAFLLDVSFFTAAVFLLMLVLRDGKLTIREAGLMVGLYGLYVAAVVTGSWWSARRKSLQEERAHRRRVRAQKSDKSWRSVMQCRARAGYRQVNC